MEHLKLPDALSNQSASLPQDPSLGLDGSNLGSSEGCVVVVDQVHMGHISTSFTHQELI